MVVELDPLARERGAGQLEPQRRRRLDLLVPRIGRDDHDRLLQAERGTRSAEQRDMTEVWRIERAAEDPGHGMNWNDSSPSWTFTPRRAPASRSARSSSSSLGGVPTTRKPSSVRIRLHGRAFGSGR